MPSTEVLHSMLQCYIYLCGLCYRVETQHSRAAGLTMHVATPTLRPSASQGNLAAAKCHAFRAGAEPQCIPRLTCRTAGSGTREFRYAGGGSGLRDPSSAGHASAPKIVHGAVNACCTRIESDWGLSGFRSILMHLSPSFVSSLRRGP